MSRHLLSLLALHISAASAANFTTYIGDQYQYQVAATTADAAGNTYVTGSRTIQIPAIGPTTSDVFVTKLDPSGSIVFATTFGGKGADVGNAVALDPAGNIWIGGSTTSANFPLRDPLQSLIEMNATTGFLVKLAPDGTVIYSSYFGGTSGQSSVNGVATDPGGNVYLTGITDSNDFLTTAGLPSATLYPYGPNTVSAAFITKLDPTGSNVLYSALILGSDVECSCCSTCFLSNRVTSGVGIAVDGAGEAIVAGNSNTTNLPLTTGGAPGYGAFAAKINAAGNKLVYLTYLGPSSGQLEPNGPSEMITATAIAVDTAGNAYVTGSTDDPLFPATPGAYQATLNANLNLPTPASNAFAIKLNPAGATIWATYLGGPGSDNANSIGVDSSGDMWLVGNNAAGFPGGRLGFVATAGDFLAELSSDGSKLSYVSEFPSGTAGQSISVDPSGTLHFAGVAGLVSTAAAAQPISSRILGIVNAAGGTLSGRIAPSEIISIFGYGLGPATPATAVPSNGQFPATLAGVQVLVNGAAIPLLYVSASQINAEIPSPLSGVENGSAIVQVINGATTLQEFRVSVDDYIVGIFQNSDGSAAAINQDGTINSPSNPAKAGSIVSIWSTGFSLSAGTPINGAVLTSANNWCSSCQISIGGVTEPVVYAGAAPGLIDGVMQINFEVPPQFGTSQYALVFQNSNPVVIYVEQ